MKYATPPRCHNFFTHCFYIRLLLGAFEVQATISDSVIKLWSPPHNQPIPWVSLPFSHLFQCLDIDHIITVWHALALERQVLLTSTQLSLLTTCSEILRSLLFPMTWSHAYIPVLPYFMIPILSAPMPFLCGIDKSILCAALPDLSPECIIVDLDKNVVSEGPQTPPLPPLPQQLMHTFKVKLEESAGMVFREARCLSRNYDATQMGQNLPSHLKDMADAAWEGTLLLHDEAFHLYYTPEESRKNLLNGDAPDYYYDNASSSSSLSMDSSIPLHIRVMSKAERQKLKKQSNWDAVQEAFFSTFVFLLRNYRKFLVFPTKKESPLSEAEDPNTSTQSSEYSYGGAGFRTDAFIRSQRFDMQPFLRQLCATQLFDNFVTKRLYSSGEADVLFFDQAIHKLYGQGGILGVGTPSAPRKGLQALRQRSHKRNGSAGSDSSTEQPLLQSAGVRRLLKTVVPPEPSALDLPKGPSPEMVEAVAKFRETEEGSSHTHHRHQVSDDDISVISTSSAGSYSIRSGRSGAKSADGTKSRKQLAKEAQHVYYYPAFPSELDPELFGSPRPLSSAVLAEFDRQRADAIRFRRKRMHITDEGALVNQDKLQLQDLQVQQQFQEMHPFPEVATCTLFFQAFTALIGKELIEVAEKPNYTDRDTILSTFNYEEAMVLKRQEEEARALLRQQEHDDDCGSLTATATVSTLGENSHAASPCRMEIKEVSSEESSDGGEDGEDQPIPLPPESSVPNDASDNECDYFPPEESVINDEIVHSDASDDERDYFPREDPIPSDHSDSDDDRDYFPQDKGATDKLAEYTKKLDITPLSKELTQMTDTALAKKLIGGLDSFGDDDENHNRTNPVTEGKEQVVETVGVEDDGLDDPKFRESKDHILHANGDSQCDTEDVVSGPPGETTKSAKDTDDLNCDESADDEDSDHYETTKEDSSVSTGKLLGNVIENEQEDKENEPTDLKEIPDAQCTMSSRVPKATVSPDRTVGGLEEDRSLGSGTRVRKIVKHVSERAISVGEIALSVGERALPLTRKISSSINRALSETAMTLSSTSVPVVKSSSPFRSKPPLASGKAKSRFTDKLSLLEIEEAKATARAQLGLAFDILHMMRERGLKADPSVYQCLIDACGRCGDTERATQLLGRMHEDGIVADGVVYACLVAAFSAENAWKKKLGQPKKEDLPEWANGATLDMDWNSLRRQSVAQVAKQRVTDISNRIREGLDEEIEDEASVSGTAPHRLSRFRKRSGNVFNSLRGKKNHHKSKTEDDSTSTLSKDKDVVVTEPVLMQILLGENLLELVYPDILIEMDTESCPRCNRHMTDAQIVAGWKSADPQSYTTTCPSCTQTFVPHFSVQSSSPTFIGSRGPDSALFCQRLSPWVLQKELRTVMSDRDQTTQHAFLSPEWRQAETRNATLWWNLVVSFMRYRLPITFLLQGNFQGSLIAPTPSFEESND